MMTSRLDRTGELIEPEDTSTTTVTSERPKRPGCAHCSDGWIGFDSEMRPIPCYRCRPHLREGTVKTNDFGADK